MSSETIGHMSASLGKPVQLLNEIASNGKCSVWLARCDELLLAIKTVTTTDPYYCQSFMKEAQLYTNFSHLPPGAGVPKAYYISPDFKTIAMEYIPGRPLFDERYPKNEEDDYSRAIWGELITLVTQLRKYSGYQLGSPDEALQRYSERWDKYISRGLYSKSDRRILEALKSERGWAPEFNHGDPVPSNILIGSSGELHLIDWEFGGAYIPHFDAAVLWATAVRMPRVQVQIEETFLSLDGANRICFATNLLNVASREVWIHKDLPDGQPIKDVRLSLVEPLMDRAREIVQLTLETL